MKVTLLTHTPDAEKVVEAAARQCYSSLDAQQIYDKPSKPADFLKRIPTTHASFIEHVSFTFAIEGISRACSHQLVRHRIASYCLAGDTIINRYGVQQACKQHSIKELYEWSKDFRYSGKIELMKIRAVNNERVIVPGKIKSVVYSGRKQIFEIKTRLGYSIKATAQHRFMTPNGFKMLEELNIGDNVMIRHHKSAHGKQGAEVVAEDCIVSIKDCGIEDTYDIEMKTTPHNFVANGFVVHNSQQSQRYVSAENFEYVTPQSIIDVGLKEWYEGVMQQMNEWYGFVLNELLQSGLKKETAQQDARFLLPNATATKIVVTMNARSLLHFFEVRLCARAQWEIRELAKKMLDLVTPVAPTIFQNAGPLCEQIGKCPEGIMACENAAVHLEKYRRK